MLLTLLNFQNTSWIMQFAEFWNFLPPWWMIIGPFSAIWEGQISKFSPTMVDDYVAILSHFRREILKNYEYRGIVSHFGYAISISQMALFPPSFFCQKIVTLYYFFGLSIGGWTFGITLVLPSVCPSVAHYLGDRLLLFPETWQLGRTWIGAKNVPSGFLN